MIKMLAITFAAAFGMAASPATAIIMAPVPANAYITFGGLDWAWASPCDAEGEDSCSSIDLSYQATQGWRIASVADFANGPTAEDFLFAGANVPAEGEEQGTGATFFGANPIDGACATAWFSNLYTHCDYGDGVSGTVWNMPGNTGQGDCCSETWVVRGFCGGNVVPEPASWAMLIAGFGLTGAVMRRRRPSSAQAA